MFLIFNTDEQQNKEKQSLAARGAGLLKRGRRKSDTQELDYEVIAARQAEMKAAAEQAEAREETERLAAARDADRAAETYDVKGHTTTGNPQVAMDEPNRKKEALRLEIAALQQILQKYGFGFVKMKESAPKSIKTREVCRDVVCFLLEEDQMIAVRRDRHLPMQIICDSLHISSKKIERHRKYILAVCEILDGDFPYLSEFLGETQAMLRGE